MLDNGFVLFLDWTLAQTVGILGHSS